MKHTLLSLLSLLSIASFSSQALAGEGDAPAASTSAPSVKSDCVTPALSETITTSGNTISTPSGQDFTTFGLPNASLTFGSTSAGSVNGKNRSCEVTYSVGTNDFGDRSYLYTCSDNGNFVCNVYLEPQ